MSNIDVSSQSTGSNPFTQLILDFKGKNIPSEQIEADYNNTLNYPNNYFVAPERWRECFYTTSRKNMLLLSEGFENIVRVKPPFNGYIMLSLFQTVRNFNSVKEQYIGIAPFTKKLYLIGPTELAAGVSLPNTEIINSTGSGLEKNWLIIVLAQDEGCALVAEEFETGRYRGLFTTNLNLANRCLEVLKGSVRTQKIDMP
ncbi:MAG: hypothetical protein WAK17_16265 [Candidatus Nitrosopolaris sp.]